MQHSQENRKINSALNPPIRPHLNKAMQTSEALQDLIDILQQNYLSDCRYCAGSGKTLGKQSCGYCCGRGKRR